MLLWLDGAIGIMLLRSLSMEIDLWRESCICVGPGPDEYGPWVVCTSYWLDATEAGWLYGEHCAMGLALPECGKFTLGRGMSARIMFGGGVGAVGGTAGK